MIFIQNLLAANLRIYPCINAAFRNVRDLNPKIQNITMVSKRNFNSHTSNTQKPPIDPEKVYYMGIVVCTGLGGLAGSVGGAASAIHEENWLLLPPSIFCWGFVGAAYGYTFLGLAWPIAVPLHVYGVYRELAKNKKKSLNA